MRDYKESSHGTLKLITEEATAGQGADSGHRQPGVMARWRLPALGIAKLNWAVAGKKAKQQELLVPRADEEREGQGPGPQDSKRLMSGVAQALEQPGCEEGRAGQQVPWSTQPGPDSRRKEAVTQRHRSKKQARGNFF